MRKFKKKKKMIELTGYKKKRRENGDVGDDLWMQRKKKKYNGHYKSKNKNHAVTGKGVGAA